MVSPAPLSPLSPLSISSSTVPFTAAPNRPVPPSHSASSLSSFASSHASHIPDPHFPATPPLPEFSASQVEEERLSNERERHKLAKKRNRRILSPSSSAIFSSFLLLPSPIKTLHQSPLAELEGLGVIEAKTRRRRRRRHKSTTKQKRTWDVKESNDLDTLPYFHSSLLYYLSPRLLQRLLSHFIFNCAVLVLTLLLAVLLILRIVDDAHDLPLEAIAVTILAFFAVEICFRLLAYGWTFFRHPWFLLSSVLTLLSFLFVTNAFGISIVINNTIALILQCVYSLLRLTAITFTLTSSARRMVSTNKTRYTQHGFDLDLCFVTPRVIAMGLPSTSIEGLYRNPIDEVARFFNTLHPHHYLIINLCAERRYDRDLFEGRVLCFPFDDHNPPPLSTIVEFCTTVDRFLAEDEKNVVAVHCKGGKGRTGTMIACWLLYDSMGTTEDGELHMGEGSVFAEEAMKVFARSRTEKGVGGKIQGVSGPSQMRYVHYFEQIRWRMMREKEERGKEEDRRRQRKRTLDGPHPPEETKESSPPPATVSPISSPRSPHSHTLSSPRAHRPAALTEEKENVESPPPTLTSASSPISPRTGRVRGASRHAEFLSYASHLLYSHPKCEVLRLVLNNAYVSKEKEAMRAGDEKSRDEWNDTWNHRDNWTLVITHYRPILPRSHQEGDEGDDTSTPPSPTHPHPSHPPPTIAVKAYVEEEKRESEAEQTVTTQRHHTPQLHLIDIPSTSLPSSSSSSPLPHPRPSSPKSPSPPRPRAPKRLTHLLADLNAYNLHRYEDVHEYYFKALPKVDGDDDTAVTFDISSFEENSRSLILSGDLKFQIYRGKVDVGEDDDDVTSSGGGHPPLHDPPPEESPQRKISRALAPLAAQTPRLFGWFWVNTAFLRVTGGGAGGPPSELILRKNQLDESFQASDIDSEFNLYLYYHCPPVHAHHQQIDELREGQMRKIREMEEERKKKEREERRRKEGKAVAPPPVGKKGKGGDLEMVEVKGGGVGGVASGAFGELEEDDSMYDEEEETKGNAGREVSSGMEVDRGGRVGGRQGEGREESDTGEDDTDADEEEVEVEEEEAEVEAEAGQADFAA